MDSKIHIEFDISWESANVKAGEVRVNEFEMKFVMCDEKFILTDPNKSEACVNHIAGMLKEIGITPFGIEQI